MDYEYYHLVALEESAYKKWERERKAQILAMTNPQRKQEEWRKLFPIMTLDDSYLDTNVDIW
jgi:hypothetical protein